MKTIEVKKKKIIIEQNVTKIYPKLENLTITPSREQQIFNHPNSYGYDEVVVEAVEDLPDDLTEELTEQDNFLTTQETTIDDIVLALEGKSVCGTDFEINDCSYLFYYGAKINIMNELLDLCKNVTDARYMFNGCSSLTSLDLSGFDTSNVTNFSNMFQGCSGLISLDLSNFDTSNVTDMNYMFQGCSALTSLDLSNFDTSQVTDMSSMFRNCSSLTSLDLSNFDTSNITGMNRMFYGCSKLANLDIRNFTFDKVTSHNDMFKNVPANCEIIVKGDTEKEWITSKFPTLTNVKTVAEL